MNLNRDLLVGLVIGLFLGVAGSFGAMTLTNQVRPAPIVIVPPEPTPLPEATATPGLLRVFVNGAVRQTAVYELPPNSLVQQAIDAAGGFTDEANMAVINLAQPLSDGLQIYVPTQGEELPAVVSMPAAAPTTSAANPTGSSNASGVININTATKDDLETLPGIGPSTAQNILDHRDANGPFQTIENIMDVSGIGEGRFNQIKELITVGN
jgi:competence protein ComEA